MRNGDYPRVGGEKLMGRPRRSVGAGSPPRGRGKDLTFGGQNVKLGITPAWAGKSYLRALKGSEDKDHPRVGGEKRMETSALLSRLGSPPRGRGKDSRQGSNLQPAGITPAWAGKRARADGVYGSYEDHPRVGGEKPSGYSLRHPLLGSPPRGRGKAPASVHTAQQARITPAWAGKR